MGNSKGKMTINAEENGNAEGKTCPTVEINEAVEGGAPSNPEVQVVSDNAQECTTNGHATATGEISPTEAAEIVDKSKADVIEECPAAGAEEGTTTTNKIEESSSKSKKKDSKPLLWLKQVKKRVSFNKKKKPCVEKADAVADANECAGEIEAETAKDTPASAEGDVAASHCKASEEECKSTENPTSDADLKNNAPHNVSEEAHQETANVDSSQ